MNKAHIWLGLCLLLALAGFRGDVIAQQEPPPADTGTGKGMDEAADAVLKAITARDTAALWKHLAPWKRNRFEHFITGFRDDEALKEVTDQEAAEVGEFLDPEDMLKIDSARRLRGLSDAEFFGLFGGVYARPMGFDEDQPENWKVVEREVGLLSAQIIGGREIQPWGGLVQYRSPGYPAITMEFRVTPAGWALTALEYGGMIMTSFSFELEEFLASPLGLAHLTNWKGLQVHRVAEGEQLLGSVRDHMRVHYAKTGEPPADVADTGVDPEVFQGEHYEVNGKVRKARDGFDAAVYARPKRLVLRPGQQFDPWVLLEWSWASGISRFEQFNKLSDLEAALDK